MTRRAFDVVVAATALVLSSPLLAIAIVAIRLESRGHPIYRQRRVGRDGREFDVLKLRTMVDGAEGLGQASRSTPAMRGSRAWARCCGARRSTSCPTSSTC